MMTMQPEIPDVDWQQVVGHFAVARTVSIRAMSTDVGGPEVIRLPYVSTAHRVKTVYSTHLTLEEAQAALLRLVRGEP